MKKTLFFAMLLGLSAAMFTACDKGNDPKPEDEPKSEQFNVDITDKTIADADYDNYSALIKRDFGFEFSDADGFTVWAAGGIVADKNGIDVSTYLNDGVEVVPFIKRYFDRIEAIAPDGIYETYYGDDEESLPEFRRIKDFEKYINDWLNATEEGQYRMPIYCYYKYNDQYIHTSVIFNDQGIRGGTFKLGLNFDENIAQELEDGWYNIVK